MLAAPCLAMDSAEFVFTIDISVHVTFVEERVLARELMESERGVVSIRLATTMLPVYCERAVRLLFL